MSDMSPMIQERYRDTLMKLPPKQRLLPSYRMLATAKRLAESAIRSKRTDQIDEETLRRELCRRLYGTEVRGPLRRMVLEGRKP